MIEPSAYMLPPISHIAFNVHQQTKNESIQRLLEHSKLFPDFHKCLKASIQMLLGMRR